MLACCTQSLFESNNAQNHPGLVNNVLYVIILSAALDLVGPAFPKGVVLLADVVPSFVTKLIAPYFIHVVPYPVRVLIFVTLSVCGMLIIALTPAHTDGGSIFPKLAGIILASLSSGAGELSFLGLTHFYGKFSIAAWSSGTGAAGLVGAGAYAVATSSLGLSVRTTLLASAFLPAIMLINFFAVLPLGPLRYAVRDIANPRNIVDRGDETVASPEQLNDNIEEQESLLGSGQYIKSSGQSKPMQTLASFQANLNRSKGLFLPL